MQFDKNAILGFVLLAVMFLGFFYFTRQGQLDVEKQKRHIQDSLAMLQPKADSNVVRADSIHLATQTKVAAGGSVCNGCKQG